MDYELITKLKKAGFPKQGFYVHTKDHPSVKKGSLAEGQGNAPTLSELIEALGECHFMLTKPCGSFWTAEGTQDGNTFDIRKGETPEEAVASLWLAIHSQELKDSKDMID